MEPPRLHEHKYVAPEGGIILHYLRSRLLSSPLPPLPSLPNCKCRPRLSIFYSVLPSCLSRAFPYVICFAWLDVPIHSREGPPFPPLPAAAVNQWSFDQHLHIILRCVRGGAEGPFVEREGGQNANPRSRLRRKRWEGPCLVLLMSVYKGQQKAF